MWTVHFVNRFAIWLLVLCPRRCVGGSQLTLGDGADVYFGYSN